MSKLVKAVTTESPSRNQVKTKISQSLTSQHTAFIRLCFTVKRFRCAFSWVNARREVEILLAFSGSRHLLLPGTNAFQWVGFSARQATMPNRSVGHFF